MCNGSDPGNPRVLLLTPTGVAAVNIDGTTTHFDLTTNCKEHLYPVNDKQKTILWIKISEVKLLITDEISIVSWALFFHINLWLAEIFGVNKPLVEYQLLTI